MSYEKFDDDHHHQKSIKWNKMIQNENPLIEKSFTFLQMFSFSDWIDKILMSVGLLASIGAAITYPLMYILYAKSAKTLVNYARKKSNNTSPHNCDLIPNTDDYDVIIKEYFELYLILGIVVFILKYTYYISWNISCERQIKNIRHVDQIQPCINYKMPEFCCMVARGVFCLIFSIFVAWKFTLFFSIFIPFIVISLILAALIQEHSSAEINAYAKAGNIAHEGLKSIRTILSLCLVRKWINKYSDSLNKTEKISKRKGFLLGLKEALINSMFNLFFSLSIYYSIFLYHTDCENFNIEIFIQTIYFMVTAALSLVKAYSSMIIFLESRHSVKKIFDILKIEPKNQSNGIKLNTIRGDMEFDNVHFCYKSNEKILKGISLKFSADNKIIALFGPNNGGKSAIMSLLQRFYEPDSGQIKIDDYNIQNFDLEWYRKQFAYVSKDPFLFTGTIKENLKIGRLDATDEEIEKAAKIAQAHDFIINMQNEYNTLIGENGFQLSKIQVQRIALARALIRNSKILIFDEPTLRMDYDNEGAFLDELEILKKNRTIFLITKNFSTIRNSDLIIFVSNGEIIEYGNHDELLVSKGSYYEYIKNEDILINKTEHRDEYENEYGNEYEIIEINHEEQNEITLFSKPFNLEFKIFKMQIFEIHWIVLGLISSIVAGLCLPLNDLFFSNIINIFIQPFIKQEGESFIFMELIIALSIMNFIANIIYIYSLNYAGTRLTRRVRYRMFESMLRQEMAFHEMLENKPSVLELKLLYSAQLFRGLTTDKFGIIFHSVSALIFCLYLSLITNIEFTLVIIIIFPLTLLCYSMIKRYDKKTYDLAKNNQIIKESIENIFTVFSYGLENYFLKIYKNNHRKFNCIYINSIGFFYAISYSLFIFFQGIAIYYGYDLIKREVLQVPDLFKIYASICFTSIIVSQSLLKIQNKQKCLNEVKNSLKIIERKSRIDSLSDNGQKPGFFNGKIKFDNVYFSYPNSAHESVVFRGINFQINKDEQVAIVCEKGCGQTTIINLLLRFYDVDNGAIYIDDINIKDLNVDWLRSKIGLIETQSVLFNNTLYKNICMGQANKENISFNDVMKAAIDSGLHSTIQLLPFKYDTLIGSIGIQLTEREKLSVSIARVLIRNPRILLIDKLEMEKYENLKFFEEIIKNSMKKRTCLVMIKNLNTILKHDKIIVINKGIVV